jgi:hypothetical protein
MQQSLPGMHWMPGPKLLMATVEQIAGAALGFPIAHGQMPHQPAESVEHGQPFAVLRHAKWPEHIRRLAARQRIHRLADRLIALAQGLRGLFGFAAMTPGAGPAGDIARVLLLLRRQRRQALETLGRIGFLQRRVDADALVEDEAFPAIVGATTLLEVLENAPVQLQHIPETLRLHVGTGFLAADAARAEHHDGLVLQLRRQFRHGSGEIPEMIHARRHCVLERAELHLVVIAGVEQGQRTPFVEPCLELARRQLGRSAARGIDARHSEGDDLLLEAHQHPPEGLVVGVAVLGFQLLEPRDGLQSREQGTDLR